MMNRKTFLTRIALSVALCMLFAVHGFAQNATRQHTVEGGETLYHISKVYNVSIDDILKANPGLSAENLKAGAVIKLPAVKAAAKPVAVKKEKKKAEKKEPTTTTAAKSATTKPAAAASSSINAALLLPLSAEGIEGGRSLEFYRGFMMAADKFEHDGASVTLYGYDEKAGETSLATTLEAIRQNGVQVILGPVYPTHFAEVAAFARLNGIRMVVPFYSKVEQVNINPYVYLINTPEKFEQEYKADLLIKTFKASGVGAVAFMRMNNGNEQAFTQYLRNRLNALGYAITEFSVDAPLEQMRSACSAKRNTVIIPDDSREDALNKVLVKMEGFKKYYPAYKTQVVGYSAWLKKEKAYAARMHAADMYVFTTSYYNTADAATKQFDADYLAQFSTTQGDVTPRMGLLGYDTGLHVLGGLLKYGKNFSTQSTPDRQLQSNIRFVRTEQDGGLISNSLFFIHYKTDGSTDKIVGK